MRYFWVRSDAAPSAPPDMGVTMYPGQMALARMACGPYSMAACLVMAMTPAFDVQYDVNGDVGAVHPTGRRPVDDGPTAGRQHRPECVLGPEQHTAQVDRQDPVELAEGDVGEGFRAGDSRHVEDGIDLAEGFERGGEHRLDVFFLRHVDVERDESVTELLRRLVLAAGDIAAEHLRAFAHEHRRRCARHPRASPGDDGHLPVQVSHCIPSEVVASHPLFQSTIRFR